MSGFRVLKYLLPAIGLAAGIGIFLVSNSTAQETIPPKAMSAIHVGSIGKPLMLAQNANYIPCYKTGADMKTVLFRWCRPELPYTATNDSRTNCYATSHDCAEAEMPQSWCIKCGVKE